jgi:glyoxylase-like metal-dependent hydrolase (beta-lactamase superfamily II)
MASFPDDVYKHIQSMMRPIPSDQWSPVQHQKVGEIDMYQLTEGVYDMDVNFPFTPPDQETIQEYLTDDNRLPRMRFGMCLLRLPNGTNVLLDAGLGPWLPDIEKCSGHPVPEKPPHPLPSLLAQIDANLTLEDIHFVVHSHCHGDHVGWVGSFPNAVHCLHQREYDFATYSGCPWRNDAVQRFEPIEQAGRLRLLEGTSAVLDEARAPEIVLELTEGHTPGHITVEIASGTERAIYIGDAMHFPLQVTHTNLAPLFDCCAWKIRPFLPFGGDNVETTWSPVLRKSPSQWNARTSATSRQRLLSRISTTQALLVSPHFPPPGMGHVTTERKETDKDGSFQFKSLLLTTG